MKLFIPAMLLLLLNGCATIKHGRTQRILVTSTPPGAVVLVDGVEQGQTPTLAEFPRKKAHVLTVELTGYAAQSRQLSAEARYGRLAPNLLWVFIPPILPVGFAVDLINGSHRDYPDEPVSFRLQSSVAASAVHGDSSDSASPVRVDSSVSAPALVPIGKRVRVVQWNASTRTAATTIGTLRAFTADTLLVEAPGSGLLYRIPQQSVASLEVSIGGNQSRVSGSRAAIGAMTGLVAGLAVGLMGILGGGDPDSMVNYMGLMTLGGGVIGAMMGPPKSDTEQWMAVCCLSQPKA